MLERFRTASPARQMQWIVAGVCVLALILAAAWAAFFRTPYQPLFSDLRTEDASAIVTALDRKKIPYRLADGGATILVPADMADGARLDVMGGDNPSRNTVGFELFNKSDMGLTDFAQKIDYQRALQGELARTIMTFDGVDSVRVHLSLGEDHVFRDDQVPPKASVTVRMKKGAVLTDMVALGIRRMVAAAVPKLDAADVVVLDERGQVIAAGTPPAAGADPAAAEKRAVEEFYEARVREAISQANPSSNVAVSVWADIADAAAGRNDLAEWSPATRNFPLQVTLSAAAVLAPDAADKVRALAQKAIAASVPQPDTIAFGAPPVAAPFEPASHAAAETRQKTVPVLPPIEAEQDDPWERLAISGPILFVFLAGAFLVWRLRHPRRLSPRRQRDFAARLKVALNEGGEDAVSQS